jgi:hypothetical protein
MVENDVGIMLCWWVDLVWWLGNVIIVCPLSVGLSLWRWKFARHMPVFLDNFLLYADKQSDLIGWNGIFQQLSIIRTCTMNIKNLRTCIAEFFHRLNLSVQRGGCIDSGDSLSRNHGALVYCLASPVAWMCSWWEHPLRKKQQESCFHNSAMAWIWCVLWQWKIER